MLAKERERERERNGKGSVIINANRLEWVIT
jgi:hypothetical protein